MDAKRSLRGLLGVAEGVAPEDGRVQSLRAVEQGEGKHRLAMRGVVGEGVKRASSDDDHDTARSSGTRSDDEVVPQASRSSDPVASQREELKREAAGQRDAVAQQTAWLGTAISSAASRGKFVLNIISPSKAREGGQQQDGTGGRHAPVDFGRPTSNISASSPSRSPGKASACAAGRPADVSMAGAADVSVTLCSALAAASKRRSKIVALESQLRMLEESRSRPGKNRIGRTFSGWRGGPHALGAGGSLLGVGLGRGYGGWGGDAASMSSVDVVCSDDDRDKDATGRINTSHDYTMPWGYGAAGLKASPLKSGRGRGALEGYEEAIRKQEEDGEGEGFGGTTKKLVEYEELIGDLHSEVQSLRKQVDEARGEAHSLRERIEKSDAERERAAAEEDGRKDIRIAQAKREAAEALDAMKKKEIEAEIHLTELESCRQSCARAQAREKEARHALASLRASLLSDGAGPLVQREFEEGGWEGEEESGGGGISRRGAGSKKSSGGSGSGLDSSVAAVLGHLGHGAVGKPVGASLSELARLQNQCRALEGETKTLKRRNEKLEQENSQLRKVAAEQTKTADTSVRNTVYAVSGMEKRMEGMRRANEEIKQDKRVQAEYILQLERALHNLLPPASSSSSSSSNQSGASPPRAVKPTPHAKPSYPVIKGKGDANSKEAPSMGGRNSLREAEAKMKLPPNAINMLRASHPTGNLRRARTAPSSPSRGHLVSSSEDSLDASMRSSRRGTSLESSPVRPRHIASHVSFDNGSAR